MWSTEYSTETGLTAPAIWAALSDLHHGVALGPQISADFPEAMETLLAAARRKASADPVARP